MAIDSETIRLALELTQTASVAEAVTALERMIQACKDSGAGLEALKLTTLQYKIAIDSETNAIDAEVQAMIEATQAQRAMSQMLEEGTAATRSAQQAAESAAPAIDGPTKGSSGIGRSALQASYAFQDFTSQLGNGPGGFARALGSIQNNIPGILMGFGVGGTVIAGVSMLAVALGAAVTNWDTLVNGMSSDAVEKAKKDLEELAAKVDEFNAMINKPTRKEAAGAKIISEAIKEGDPAKIARVLTAQLTRSGRGEQMTDKEKSGIAEFAPDEGGNFKSRVQREEYEARKNAADERVRKANEAQVQAAIVDVTKGGGEAAARSRTLLSSLAAPGGGAMLPGLPAGFVGALERSDPKDIERQTKTEALGDLNAENMKRHAKEKAKQKALNKEVADAEHDAAQGAVEIEAAEKKEARAALKAHIKSREALRKQAIDEQENADAEWNRQVAADTKEANQEKRDAAQAATKQRAQQRAVEARQFHQAMNNIQDANVQLEQEFKNQLDFAKMNGATQQMVEGIHRRHDYLKNQIDAQERFARRSHERVQESMMQGNDG